MGHVSPPRPAEPILHVDMDAFYAAVEARRDPSLAGREVLVGGTGGRGVVASASYEARRYGIHSAMPMAEAKRRCPHAVVIAPDFACYEQVSAQVHECFRAVTPLVEPLSLDEAFLDVGGAVRLLGHPVDIGETVRRRIRDELGLPASVGVAANKFLAKLASTRAKPDGLVHLPAAEGPGLLRELPVTDLWGVGERTADALARYGIRRVADVLAAPEATLVRILGPSLATHLRGLARGRDPRPVVPHEPAKGVSAEQTFAEDVDDPGVVRTEVLHLAERVARRLRRDHVAGRTVTLKLRDAAFRTVTRSRTRQAPTDEAAVVHEEATAALDALRLERIRVRLVGVGVGNLVPADAARQLSLLGHDRWAPAERAADEARDRFGETAVTRGALLDRSD